MSNLNNLQDMVIQINASLYIPEVILNQQDRTLFFNFYQTNREAHSDYLVFMTPMVEYLQQATAPEQTLFHIYFDKSLAQMEEDKYCAKLFEKLKSLPHQERIRYIFKN